VPATAVAAAYNCYRGNFVYSWYILKAMALGLGAFLVQFPRRCLESGQRTYAFWPRIDEGRVYPPACRGSEAGGKD
jgi:hypothetical protein